MVNFELIKKNIYNNLNEDSKSVSNFKSKLSIIKESDILNNEYHLYKGIKEYVHINNGITISFLKEIFSYFDSYTIQDINEAHSTLMEGISLTNQSIEPIDISINTLLEFHLNGEYNKPSMIKKYNKAVNEIVEFIKNNPLQVNTEINEQESVSNYNFNLKQIIPIVSKNFNEKYSNFLSEEEMTYLVDLSTLNENKEMDVLNIFKSRAIESLSNDKELDSIMVNECVDKIKSINYNSDTFYNDLISIYDLIS